MNGTGRVGFVIDSQVPSWAAVRGRKAHPWAPLTGWPGSGSVARMRFGWIADRVNAEGGGGALHYEIYKPWRRYAAVVFLKSMGAECAALAERLRDAGTRVVFDLNVDYLTPADGRFYYEGMAPTPEQHAAALAMVKLADLVIADSSHLAAVAARQHANVAWVADNVEMRLAPAWRAWRRTGKLPLLWSGEAAKLFELLAIESALRRVAGEVRLVLVTSALTALERWPAAQRARLEALLARVEHEIIAFRSIPQLFRIYASGGLFIAPRHLDNTYNMGHTEWKITLPMACGRGVLASPVPSYADVARRGGGRGVRLCASGAEWDAALGEALRGGLFSSEEEAGARETVQRHYSTAVIAAQHRGLLSTLLRTSSHA